MATITLPAPLETFEDKDELLSDRPWNVVLLDDDSHTFDYVIEMLGDIFGYPFEVGLAMADEVNEKKRVIVWSGHLEHAEAKKAQIESYGADWRIDTCQGSMSAKLERT